MEKTLLYPVTAILLGILTMLVPFALVTLNLDMGTVRLVPFSTAGRSELAAPSNGNKLFDNITSPSTLSSVGFILIPSFLSALGISLYVKKRIG